MRIREVASIYECDCCKKRAHRYDNETMTDADRRLFREGWLALHDRFYFCDRCVYILLFKESVKLSTFPNMDQTLSEFQKNAEHFKNPY